MILDKFVRNTDFNTCEDFLENFRVHVPANFNFAFDVVDAIAGQTPHKLAVAVATFPWFDPKPGSMGKPLGMFDDGYYRDEQLTQSVWHVFFRSMNCTFNSVPAALPGPLSHA